MNQPDRFWARVDKRGPDECWEWQGCRTSGYGQLSVGGGKRERAHRVAWRLHHAAEIPDALVVIHSCDNPPCCNPAHLRLGTLQENSTDRVNRRRQSKGETHGCAKLSSVGVREIRDLLAKGVHFKTIARQMGVSPRAITLIRSGRTWRYVR